MPTDLVSGLQTVVFPGVLACGGQREQATLESLLVKARSHPHDLVTPKAPPPNAITWGG